MASIAFGLGLPKDLARKPKPSAHQDVASITIHFTNNRSDLHYMDASGTRVHEPPPAPGVATVTPSSLRRRWSNDMFAAPPTRTKLPASTAAIGAARVASVASVALVRRPKLDAVIRACTAVPGRAALAGTQMLPGHGPLGPRTGLRLEGRLPPPPRWPVTPAMPPRHSCS
jgi:isopenicillin N synthase-like dioxygenase